MGALQRNDTLLFDTNAILEALRVRGWKALASYYHIETVAECVQELGTGSHAVQEHVTLVQQTACVHEVSPTDRAEFRLSYKNADLLHAGEQDLLCHALRRRDVWFLCSPDKAVLRALHALHLLDRAVSLEMALKSGNTLVRVTLRDNYTERWLARTRTQLKLSGLNKGA